MRVECTTFSQFCDELESECNDTDSTIHRNIVRLRMDTDQPNKDTGNYNVGYWLTVLVEKTTAGMFCLELGLPLGLYVEGEGGPDYECPLGAFKSVESTIRQICETHGLTIREGKYELF